MAKYIIYFWNKDIEPYECNEIVGEAFKEAKDTGDDLHIDGSVYSGTLISAIVKIRTEEPITDSSRLLSEPVLKPASKDAMLRLHQDMARRFNWPYLDPYREKPEDGENLQPKQQKHGGKK